MKPRSDRSAGWICRGLLGLLALAGVRDLAADWPQFLGPERNGVTTETLAATFPLGGPKTSWSAKVGSGWSGPIVVGGRVLLQHRIGDEEILESWEVGTGKSVWKSAQPTHYRDDFGFDNGPRGTPCAVADSVYTFGAEGRLTALKLTDGKALWSRLLGTELRGDKGFFGFACSPLVVSNLVIVQLGGADGAGVVAVRTSDGTLAWKATEDEAGYAAPIQAVIAGQTRVVVFNRAGLSVLDPTTGKVRQRHPWRSSTHASVNAATPVVLGDRVFLTTSYETGAILLDLTAAEPKTIWSGDDAISAHYASVVVREGLIFGYHGRQESGPVFRCIEAATGKVKWTEAGSGGGSVLRAGTTLLLLRDSGELQLAEASGIGFKPTDRMQILGTQTRALPALSGGFLFARDRTKLVAVDLRSP